MSQGRGSDRGSAVSNPGDVRSFAIACRRRVDFRNLGRRIDPAKVEPDARRAVLPVAVDHIEFRDPDLVRERDLSNGLLVRFRGTGPVDGVDERQHARNAIESVQSRLRKESLQHRARLGKA